MGDKGTTQTQTTTLPSWESTDVQNLLGQTNSQTNSDIAAVPYSQVENQLGQDSNNILGNQVNTASLTAPETSMESNSWTNPGVASSFMNPYENTALASQVNLNEQTQLNPELAGIQQSAAASGALGGDRDQVLQGQAINQFNQNQQNVIAQGENQAYNAGQGQYNTQQGQQLAEQQAANQTTLGGAASNVYANLAAGQNYQNEVGISEAPEQQLATEMGVVAGEPNQSTVTGETRPNGMSTLGGIFSGLIGAGGSLLSSMGYAKGGLVDEGLGAGSFKPKKKKKMVRGRRKAK